jgi:ubiquinone/menaquinone biosynthesis C-methylase UbiE
MSQNTEHWDHYWHNSKSLNSFSEGDAAMGYGGSTQSYWHKVFKLTADNAVIVDIASGNGALAVAAVTYSEQHHKNFKVYACDLAAIAPETLFKSEPRIVAKLKQIQFYPATAIEKLPFDSNSIDLIISQFGFEYAEQKAALAECNRVLKQRGNFKALVHHADSFISKDSQAGLNFYQECLKPAGFLMQTEQLLELEEECWQSGNSPITQLEYVGQKKQLFQVATNLKAQHSDTASAFWCDDLLYRLAPVLANPKSGNYASFLSFKHSIELYVERLKEQVKASWSHNDGHTFLTTFQSALPGLQLEPFYEQDSLFCWSLGWRK